VRGPSGSGKSLLLRAVVDLDRNAGEVWLGPQRRNAVAAHHWRRRVGLLPAESHWWEDQVGAHQASWPEATLETLGFGIDVLGWSVSRLSTGEKQRLALARLLANRPAALLLDEPVANLDAQNAERVVKVIDDYRRAHHTPILWVSHGEENAAIPGHGTLWLDGGRVVKRELPWS
jgi:ABC-type lipoprotein export system ATPase subunit